jgi:imidazole glycerol-phosphate synthase subunit HisF
MLRPRIIPCLLIHKGGLVKTVKFAQPKYVGDPLNAVRIFNEKEVDELFVADIDATIGGREPDYALIRGLAAECRMPLCYAGGVRTVEQVERIIGLGVEKVALSSAAMDDPTLITRVARNVGSQSVVVVIDAKASKGRYDVFTHNGTRSTGKAAVDVAVQMQRLGAGEIVINSIDQDGAMKGYDLQLAKLIREAVTLPLTVLGGAGSLRDISKLIDTFGIIGAAAGSLFVFKGTYRAVLINYPNRRDKEALAHGLASPAG